MLKMLWYINDIQLAGCGDEVVTIHNLENYIDRLEC